ncbi:MAG: hypothetical protein MJ090_06255, partial [Clostridia bacterium]|nr:hypothetical protein [Clostridia bacterium]
GGIRVNDPSSDLGVIAAVASCYKNRTVEDGTVILGEVGLAGEVRGVRNAVQRVREAAKLGYRRAVVPEANKTPDMERIGIRIDYVKNILKTINGIRRNNIRENEIVGIFKQFKEMMNYF